MPLYEYQCKECARRTEKIQKFSDPDLTTCPHCGGPLERTLTAPAVHFAGGGWYKDLYSSAKPAASNSPEGGPGNSAPAAASGGESAGAASAASATAPAAPAATPAASNGGSSSAPAKS